MFLAAWGRKVIETWTLSRVSCGSHEGQKHAGVLTLSSSGELQEKLTSPGLPRRGGTPRAVRFPTD